MTLMNLQLAVRNPARKSAYLRMQSVGESQSLLDSSLTSLSWLQNLRVLDLVSPEVALPTFPSSPCSEDGFSWETVSSSSPEEKNSSQNVHGISLSPIRKCLLQSAEFRSAPRKYRSSSEKPSFSCTTLIYLAIRHSKSRKLTLSDIYRWIKENFKYYRAAEPSWQNSIRHNLSLNEMFVKVPRSNGDSRKGYCWKINPDYEHILSDEHESHLTEHTLSQLHHAKVTAKSRKRAHSQSCYGAQRRTAASRKRIKSENQGPADPCGLPGDLDWVSLLSSQKVNCGSCPSQSCRPAFGSPVLGPPDLGHIGEPVVCSPLVPTSEHAELPQTPLLFENRGALLEEVVLKQDSPSPLLLPWAESRPQSPGVSHPWAESRETTLHEIRNMYKSSTNHRNQLWSPESSWSSGSTFSTVGLRHSKRTPLLNEACSH